MRNMQIPIRKRGFFRTGKEIKGLRGGVHRYAAQVSPQIDAARAEKDRFRMETNRSYENARDKRASFAEIPGYAGKIREVVSTAHIRRTSHSAHYRSKSAMVVDHAHRLVLCQKHP